MPLKPDIQAQMEWETFRYRPDPPEHIKVGHYPRFARNMPIIISFAIFILALVAGVLL